MIQLSVGDIDGVCGKFRIGALNMRDVDTEIVENFLNVEVSNTFAPYLIVIKYDVPPAPWGMYWGEEGFIINTTAVIAQYWPDTMELECFENVDQAAMVLQWMKGKQDEWRDKVLSHNRDESERQRSRRKT